MRIVRIATLCLAGALAPLSAAAEISDSKRALAVELIEIASGPQPGDRVVGRFLQQLEPRYAGLVTDLMSTEKDLEPVQREALEQQLADFDAFRAAFETRFPEQVDLRGVLVETYVPLYDRYFEEQELAEIVAFYRSEAGRKMVRVLPALLPQGITRTMERLEPELMRVVGLVLYERRQQLLDEGQVR
jgi:hypothetical protein